MILISVNLHKVTIPIGPYSEDSVLDPKFRGLPHTENLDVSIGVESVRLFDVCNGFIDALGFAPPTSGVITDIDVFYLIKQGAIPQVPTFKRGEIIEFIQKISFALSATARLIILRELQVRPMIRATVAMLEMGTGIANQTVRRHLKVLLNCRLVKRTRVGQTYLYESMPTRLPALTYLWNILNQVGDA